MLAGIKDSHVHYLSQNNDFLPQIICIGYNNFNYLKGVNILRQQDFYTLHFVLSGKGSLKMRGIEYPLAAGDVFFCPPDEFFSYYPDGKNPWEYVWLSLKKESLPAGFEPPGLSANSPCRRLAEAEKIKMYLEEFFGDSVKNGGRAEYRAYAVWFNMLAELKQGSEAASAAPQQAGKMHVKHALDCIRSNYTNPDFKVSHIPGLIFVSHSYLCRIFLKETGVSIIGYLKSCRLKQAARLLRETGCSVKETALKSGYDNYSHFCKAFLKEYGKTPTGYRNS